MDTLHEIVDTYPSLVKKYKDLLKKYPNCEESSRKYLDPFERYKVLTDIFPEGHVFDPREVQTTTVEEKDDCNYEGAGDLVTVQKFKVDERVFIESVVQFLYSVGIKGLPSNKEERKTIIIKIAEKITRYNIQNNRSLNPKINDIVKKEITEYGIKYISYVNEKKEKN